MRRIDRARQRGVALIALLAVIALGASWFLVTALNNNTANRLALQRAHNAKVLEEAKRALLGWAALNAADTTDVNPGRLPCPEDTTTYYNASTEGTAAATCAAGTQIGRLPWRTLGIPKLLDASGEPLWYVVSNGWTLTTAGTAIGINSNSAGQLTLGTQTPVALIIAPGPAITIFPTALQSAAGCVARTQNRNFISPALPDYRDYLECQNATSPVDSTFVTEVTGNAANPVFNDQLVAVSSAEVLNAIEGPVAKRIQAVVVPQLQNGASQWSNSSATNPIFPFAARLTSAGTFNPDSSQGSTGTSQGLLPLTRSQSCDPITDSRCSTTFIQWTLASLTTSHSGGNATSWSSNCAASTSSEIQCSISYSRFCGSLIFDSSCDLTGASFTAQITAPNAGMALRILSTSTVSGLTSPAISASMGTNGAASVTVQGTLADTSCQMNSFLFILWTCTASSNVTVSIPITVLQDHPLLSPAATDNWYWFIANKWYDVTYYAVAASHLPSGATHDCSTVGDCIIVANGNPATGLRALVALAGRSLNGTIGSNRALTDFLDSTENQNGDRAFEQKTVNKSFNDRLITVSNY